MKKINKISLIIPCNEGGETLDNLLFAIFDGETLPDELIIVDATVNAKIKIEAFEKLQFKYDVSIKLVRAPGAFPGKARNKGVLESKNEVIAFLDVKTIPQKNWLSVSMNELLLQPDIDGIWGRTIYEAKTKMQDLIRCATYGAAPLLTVPGTLIKRNALYKVGQFIPDTRAGEDTDWMRRLNIQGISMGMVKACLIYTGLKDLSILRVFIKWMINYSHASRLPYLFAHKNLYYHAFVFVLLVIAFNWNWVVAKWNEDSELYFPHLTKITFLLLAVAYSYLRGILLPLKKGYKLRNLLPINWILVLYISALLDLAKIVGFLWGSLRRVK